MKPKLILCVGTGWSATTPLYFTFQENKVSTGLQKETHILAYLQSPFDFTGHMKNRFETGVYSSEGVRPRTVEEDKLARVWVTPSLDSYILFFKRYYNLIKDEYQAVCDFSTTYAGFTDEIIATFADRLKKEFDVRVIMILRDPFRRMFSHMSHVNKKNPLEVLETSYLYMRRFPRDKFQFPLQLSNLRLKNYEPFANSNYALIYKNWSKHFPTHSIIMEDLWAGRNSELERLNGFLGTNITKLHENAYYPDKGSKAPHYKALEDQWSSDTVDLKPEHVERGRRAMSQYYEEWESLTGVNPWRDDEWV